MNHSNHHLAAMFAACALGFSAAGFAQSADNGWIEVWRDDFNGTSLDSRNWNIEQNNSGGGNQELQYYGPEGVRVEDGNLVITASRDENWNRKFTSGRITTKGKVFFTHGKVEARIILPKTKGGLWPAFWMLGNDIDSHPWPRSGEIDILEMGNREGFGGHEETYMNGACHWGSDAGNHPNYARSSNAPYSVQDGEYHLYTLEWTPKTVKMYLDLDRNPGAAPYFEMSITANGVRQYLHKPYFIIFNLAIGGGFPGIFKPEGITADFPAVMKVDWVRVCQPADHPDYSFGVEPESPEIKHPDNVPLPAHSGNNTLFLFSHGHEGVSEIEIGNWNQTTQAETVLIAGRKAMHLTKFNYLGWELTPDVDVTDYDYMHVDFFTPTGYDFGFTPVSRGPLELRWSPDEIRPGQWNSLDAPLNHFYNVDLANVFQIKFDNGDGGEGYIGNVYFWKNDDTGIDSVADLESEPEYYNLQGIRILNPGKGVFIRRCGARVERVMRQE